METEIQHQRVKGGYRSVLLEELAARKSRNTAYSMRAFARDLGVGAATLCDVLSGKRRLSKKNALRIANRLSLSPAQTAQLLGEIRGEINGDDFVLSPMLQLEEDTFTAISEWYYFAILNLANLKDNQAAPEWVAHRLGLSLIESRGALERLLRMGFLKEEKGRLVRTTKPLTTTEAVPSSALRKYHKQLLDISKEKMDEEPISRRVNSAITMAADPVRLEEARKMIIRFRDKLCHFLESGNGTEVFILTMHLFPVTKQRGNA